MRVRVNHRDQTLSCNFKTRSLTLLSITWRAFRFDSTVLAHTWRRFHINLMSRKTVDFTTLQFAPTTKKLLNFASICVIRRQCFELSFHSRFCLTSKNYAFEKKTFRGCASCYALIQHFLYISTKFRPCYVVASRQSELKLGLSDALWREEQSAHITYLWGDRGWTV